MCWCFKNSHKELETENRRLLNENICLREALDECQNYQEPEKPDWLDDSQLPYEPLIEIEGEKIKLLPQDIYMECRTLREKALKWRELPLNERLWEIWKFVIVSLKYKYDKEENWLPPIVSLVRGWGDCEDGTILFITLARLAHIDSDKVFNACGWYHEDSQKFGHSYPIAKMEDEKWYIFETTLDSIPGSPKLFEGSNYTADWGVANWQYAGVIKDGNQI